MIGRTWLGEMSVEVERKFIFTDETLKILEKTAEFTTVRRSFSLKEDGVQVDLDQADFGYNVGEIEVLVKEDRDVQSALEKIENAAQKLGLTGNQKTPGKMHVFLRRYLPSHYDALRKAHILTNWTEELSSGGQSDKGSLRSMGSQSSSGMSGGRGSSSGTPAESEGDNQGLSRRSDRQQGDRQSSEEDVDLAEVLAYLLRRGQVRLVHGSGATGLQLVQSYSDSDEDSDGAWEGRLGDRYNPPVDVQPDTNEVDRSEIRTQILLATASSTLKGRHSFTHMLTEREQGRCRASSFSHGECNRIQTHFLPNYVSHKDTYQQKAFCGVYSENGNMFLSACQDQNIRLYDTTRGRFKLRRTVKARDVGWSVLDVCFTPDAQHVLYSSWSDYIHMCSIESDGENHTALDLNPDERRFCVFSLAASTDGKEILGGANDGCLYVFDLEQNKRTLKIDAHEDDVNAVAFADSSSQLLFSGSDDALCKVWDRRTLREDRPQPVGQLAGHRDGITFIHSKGDARYLISNSKDQSIKLWDIRKFSPKEGLAASRLAVTQQNWDYRWQQVPQRALKRHKLTGDTSVMTYRGHGVLHTLIRCRFSPEFSTGQRFIYSGCSTGKIIIYDVLTGGVVTRLSGHDACVRDVSWHPFEDNIISSSWDGAVRMWEHRQTHPLEEERERAPAPAPAAEAKPCDC
uniref:CYTH domain-containing protein n=1 Tax=Knipowitschia caucasica TaxID=637954 RepID=A0AAV2L5P9_KNICA